MKRILIFSTAYYPHVGGAEVAIKEITDRIVPTECVFDLITLRIDANDAPTEVIGNVHVYRVGSGGLWGKVTAPLAALFKTLELVRTQKYDLFWVMMVSYIGGAAYLANGVRFWDQVPITLTLQEGDSERYIRTKWGGLVGLSWRLALMYATKVTAISTYLMERARAYGYRGTVMLIPNGVAIQSFVGNKTAHPGIVLVTTSRLVHKNAIDDVIRALPELPSTVRFQVLGSGSDEKSLKELAVKQKVSDKVEFVGHVDREQMPAYLHAADIFVRPSRSEGQGISFLEAMAAGLPVVATQEGGIADFLFDAKRNPEKPTTGWAVDKDSPDQIVATVQDIIIANPVKVAEVTANALALVKEKYDWSRIARMMLESAF